MHLFLIDGTYELFRYYYAVPSARDAEGAEVGAVRGVVGSVLGFARSGELTELPANVVSYVDRLEARPARQRAVAVTIPG